jgi:hypothetical protein
MALSEGAVGPLPAESDRLQHDCPTEPGSGGAPVLDTQMRWVGMHEMKRMRGGPGEVNLAVRADRIARDLRERGIVLEPPPERGTPELPGGAP